MWEYLALVNLRLVLNCLNSASTTEMAVKFLILLTRATPFTRNTTQNKKIKKSYLLKSHQLPLLRLRILFLKWIAHFAKTFLFKIYSDEP